MPSSKEYDEIIREITAGFTGDPSKDLPYLKSKCEEYKDHKMSKEIARACGRMMYEMLPDDAKEELNKASEKDFLGTNAILEEINFNIFKKNYDTALQMIEGQIKKIEAANMFQDDHVSEYHQFNEFFEEALYRFLAKPTKEIRQVDLVPYSEIYRLYGSLLIEKNRLAEARDALKKGLHWNPVSFVMASEYIETYRMEGDMKTFYEKSIEAFKIAIHAPQVARCFRNLGYYFTEKKLYTESIAAYMLSMRFEKDAKQVQSELYYISQIAGKIERPSFEQIKQCSEKYGFPVDANETILGLAATYGKSFLEKGEKQGAKYCLGILYELTQDNEIKKIIDSQT